MVKKRRYSRPPQYRPSVYYLPPRPPLGLRLLPPPQYRHPLTASPQYRRWFPSPEYVFSWLYYSTPFAAVFQYRRFFARSKSGSTGGSTVYCGEQVITFCVLIYTQLDKWLITRRVIFTRLLKLNFSFKKWFSRWAEKDGEMVSRKHNLFLDML